MSLKILITNGIKQLKEGDTSTEIKMLLLDGNGVVYDIAGKTTKFVVSNKFGKLFEKPVVTTATSGEVVFSVDEGEITGSGQLFLEVHVQDGTGTKIFPSADYLVISVDENLNVVGQTISFLQYEELKDVLSEDLNFDVASLQNQIDTLVVEGDSSPEAAQARIGLDNTIYATLKDRLDNELKNKQGLSPKGVYATLSDLQTAFPSGNQNVYLVSSNANWYFYNGTQWTSGGVFQAAEIQNLSVGSNKIMNKAITKEKISEMVKATGRNLFSKTDIEPNKYVIYNTGQVADNTLYIASGFIPVLPSTEYNFNRMRTIVFYDANKNYITGVDNPTYTWNYPRTSPSTAAFVRVSFRTEDLDMIQVVVGNLSVDYESYLYELVGLVVNEKQLEPRLSLLKLKANQLSSLKSGKNLFNKNDRSLKGYIGYTTGVFIANDTYDSTDYIRVEPNASYVRSYAHQMAWYTKDKAYISGVPTHNTDPNAPQVVVAPANAYYARLTIPVNVVDRFQFEPGTVATPYEKFKLTFDETVYPNENAIKEVVNTKIVSVEKTIEAIPGYNLYNAETVTVDVYVNYATGITQPNTTYVATDFIPINPSTNYMRTHSHMVAFYNDNKAFLSGLNSLPDINSPSMITSPANAKFMRLTVPKTQYLSFMVHEGSSLLPYKPYSYTLKNLSFDSLKDEVLIFLPPELPIAVGRTIELYNNQVVWTGNLKNFHVKWSSTIGSAFKRKWSFTGITAKIGNHTLTCSVYDNNMKLVATATTTVKVTDATLTTVKKLLCIGDSLSNRKAWMPELNVLSGGKIDFVGTRTWVDAGVTYKHEGRSGFSAGGYLSATSYDFESEGVHPFWNPGTSSFDYGYYKTQNNISPDAIQLFLGTNGIALDPTVNATNIKTIVDKIRENDATIPIYVVLTLYRGDQNGMGRQLSSDGYSAGSNVWKLEEDRKVFNLVSKVYDLLKNYSNVRFIPIAHTHDSEFNFMSGTYPVNPRSTITEMQHNEATHPQLAGYLQMADIIFSTWCLYND